jgi:ferredoxin
VPEEARRASISVDRAICIGSGVCIAYAPGTFAHDEETRAVIIDAAGDAIESIRTAVEACPTGALTLSD